MKAVAIVALLAAVAAAAPQQQSACPTGQIYIRPGNIKCRVSEGRECEGMCVSTATACFSQRACNSDVSGCVVALSLAKAAGCDELAAPSPDCPGVCSPYRNS